MAGFIAIGTEQQRTAVLQAHSDLLEQIARKQGQVQNSFPGNDSVVAKLQRRRSK